MLKKSLVALAMGTFALGISEFSMMGILSNVAGDLAVSIPFWEAWPSMRAGA